MDAPTLFVIVCIGIMIAVVLVCGIATLIVNGCVRRKLHALETEFMAQSAAMIVRETFRREEQQ